MRKFAYLAAALVLSGGAMLFTGQSASAAPVGATPMQTTETGNTITQKVGWHSRWRSHWRWGSRGHWHSRWRSHYRWGSHGGWHNRWRSHHRWGSRY